MNAHRIGFEDRARLVCDRQRWSVFVSWVRTSWMREPRKHTAELAYYHNHMYIIVQPCIQQHHHRHNRHYNHLRHHMHHPASPTALPTHMYQKRVNHCCLHDRISWHHLPNHTIHHERRHHNYHQPTIQSSQSSTTSPSCVPCPCESKCVFRGLIQFRANIQCKDVS